MISIELIETLIGLASIYILFSMIASTGAEWIARRQNSRAKLLQDSLREAMFGGPGNYFADRVFAHPAIRSLSPIQMPTYISSKTFALTVIDLAIKIVPPAPPTPGQTTVLKTVNDATAAPLMAETRTLIETIVVGTNGSIGHVQDRLEKWYDELMMRVSGVYKRLTHAKVAVLSIFLAVAFNIDTVFIVKALQTAPAVRQALAGVAQEVANNSQLKTPQDKIDALNDRLMTVPLPIGWHNPFQSASETARLFRESRSQGILAVLQKSVGWALSIVAISLGAPFWFDLLTRLVNLRQVGEKPPSSLRK